RRGIDASPLTEPDERAGRLSLRIVGHPGRGPDHLFLVVGLPLGELAHLECQAARRAVHLHRAESQAPLLERLPRVALELPERGGHVAGGELLDAGFEEGIGTERGREMVRMMVW